MRVIIEEKTDQEPELIDRTWKAMRIHYAQNNLCNQNSENSRIKNNNLTNTHLLFYVVDNNISCELIQVAEIK